MSVDECNRLRNENEVLRKRVKKGMKVVRSQKKLLDNIRAVSWKYLKIAEKVLLQKSGVERGKWAYHKGLAAIAGPVFKIVIVDWSKLVEDLL